MSDLSKSLRLRENELRESLAATARELSDIQSRSLQLQRELDMVSGLLAIHDRDQSTKSPAQKPIDSPNAVRLHNGAKSERTSASSPNSFEGSVSTILAASGESMHISAIENELRERKIPIPGRGTTANIITRMRRANGQFTRVGSGTYALAEWNLEPMMPKRRRRRKSGKRSKKSNV